MPGTALVTMALLMACLSAGCVHRGGPVPSSTASAVLQGTLTADEDIVLPDDAIIEIWLADASPGTTGGTPVAHTTLLSRGRRMPLAFALRYDPDRLEPDRRYAVRATVRSGGQIVLVTAGAPPEITRGHAGDIGRLHLQHAFLSPLAQSAGRSARGTAWGSTAARARRGRGSRSAP
jgi:putative lipoprotein